jgi:hypothetical protein
VNRVVQVVVLSVAACIVAAKAEPAAVVTFNLDSLRFGQYVHDDDTFQIPDVARALYRVDSVSGIIPGT